jgi:aerobic carbon-monoxide dehydrogenase medium subunit
MAQLFVGLKEYHRPETVEEAFSLLEKKGWQARILAGGTSLAFSRPKIESVVDITRLPFRGCSQGKGGLEIGSLTTIRELEKNQTVRTYAGGVLVQACDRLATTPLRNLITAGGNIMGGFTWSDLPAVFLSLDAGIRYFNGSACEKSFETDGKFSRQSLLGGPGVLMHIILPETRRTACAAFTKFARTATDLSMATVAVSFIMNGSIMSEVRIACSGLVTEPQRITAAEACLEGRAPSDEVFAEAGAAASAAVKPRQDTRAGADYRLSILGTLVERTCVNALGGN